MTEENAPRIEEADDGPLIAIGIPRLVDADGTEHELKPRMALCRCGQSSNKPFCDGSHNKAGFKSRTDKDPSGKDKVYSYEGNGETVLYNPRICSHAARCIATAGQIFDSGKRPWIEPANGTRDDLAAAVRNCPSGALQLVGPDGPEQLVDEPDGIVIEKDGPYWVRGADIGVDSPGEGGTKMKYVLCRCGLSGNKPYCDGSHYNEKWTAE